MISAKRLLTKCGRNGIKNKVILNKKMGALAIREKLQEYIRIADDKKVKAIYTIIENDINEFKWWQDVLLLKQWNTDYDNYEGGKEKGYTSEEVKLYLDKVRKGRIKSK